MEAQGSETVGVSVTPQQVGAAGTRGEAGMGTRLEAGWVGACVQFLDFNPSSNKRELHDSLDIFSSKPFIFFLESSGPILLPGILQKQLLPVWALKNEMHKGYSIAQAECNVPSDRGSGGRGEGTV